MPGLNQDTGREGEQTSEISIKSGAVSYDGVWVYKFLLFEENTFGTAISLVKSVILNPNQRNYLFESPFLKNCDLKRRKIYSFKLKVKDCVFKNA